MFTRLILKNFQNHLKKVIDLDFRVTTIVGDNRTGKSALIRAWKWLCFNKPGGEAYRRHGSKTTSVTAHVDNRVISRRRGKDNTYTVDGEEFRSFGAEPPPAVSEILNMSDVTFQGQHEAPFWFCKSPGEVSRQFNRIVDLEAIDKCLERVDSSTRRLRVARSISAERIKDTNRMLRESAWTVEMEEDLYELEQVHGMMKAATEQAARIDILITTAREAREIYEDLSASYRECEDAFRDVKAIREDLRTAVDVEDRLRRALNQVESARKRSDSAERSAEQTETEFHDRMEGKICPICGSRIRRR